MEQQWWTDLNGDEIRSIYRGQLLKQQILLPELVNVAVDYACDDWRRHLRPAHGQKFGRLECKRARCWIPVMIYWDSDQEYPLIVHGDGYGMQFDLSQLELQSRTYAAPGTHLPWNLFNQLIRFDVYELLSQQIPTVCQLFRAPIMVKCIIRAFTQQPSDPLCILDRNMIQFCDQVCSQILSEPLVSFSDKRKQVDLLLPFTWEQQLFLEILWAHVDLLLPLIGLLLALTAEEGRWAGMIVDRLFRPACLAYVGKRRESQLFPFTVLDSFSMATFRQLCASPYMPKPFMSSPTYQTLVRIARHDASSSSSH